MRSGVCAVIVILLLVSFCGCTESDSDDDKMSNYYFKYMVEIEAEVNGSYRVILPILLNNSGDTWEKEFDLSDIQPPPPPLTFSSGSGTYSYNETEYGKGLEVRCNGSIHLEAVKYDRKPEYSSVRETFLSLYTNQSGERNNNGTPFQFYVYFEGYENLTQVVLKHYDALLGYHGSTNIFRVNDQLLENGWNEITISWSRRS